MMLQHQLNELRQWTERVSNCDHRYVFENRILVLDCSTLHHDLLPKLASIYADLRDHIASQAFDHAQKFCDDLAVVLQV